MTGQEHTIEIDVPRGPKHSSSNDWGVAGLALATEWAFQNGETQRAEKAIPKESRHPSGTVVKPRIVFDRGKSMDVEQFIGDVKEGVINPEGPAAHSLAKALNHPKFREDGESDAE